MKLTASKTDESMYLLKRGNKLHGIDCVVVDDLCMVGDDLAMKEFEKLKTEFSFGKWNRESGTFCGRDITRTEDGGFRISQQKKVDGLEDITIPKGVVDHEMAGPRLIQELRTQIGQGLYVARESRLI